MAKIPALQKLTHMWDQLFQQHLNLLEAAAAAGLASTEEPKAGGSKSMIQQQ